MREEKFNRGAPTTTTSEHHNPTPALPHRREPPPPPTSGHSECCCPHNKEFTIENQEDVINKAFLAMEDKFLSVVCSKESMA
ncbi:hypothetical protein RHMOL_Rhmol04G0237800 [Rhododendron molle]|uniref:Uncharacterized protein n=1 Tax=Rhododendron molle TaxID=49168 RepID=A0ACC0P4R7_RHOML|nr:hypothetical protein RHMOL_Rhmol04G0237800 [Rhododendron molle]